MVQFNELRITQDRKHLIVDVQVLEMSYYENVYLGSIIIDTQKTFSAAGPSSHPIFTIDCEGAKHFRQFIDIDSIADNLFFVYVTTTGEPADDTPCGMADEIVLGVTYDKYPIYLLGMKLLSQMEDCDVNAGLKDFILLNSAFNISLQAGNYPLAIEYWNMFFNLKEQSVKSNCGCHGIFR